MNNFYDNIRDVSVTPLIKKYGLALTLRRTVKGSYDPNTDTMIADTITDYPCFGLITDYRDNMIAASLVQRGDKKLLVTANGVPKPEIGDQFIGMPDGVWYVPDGTGNVIGKFQPVETLAPAGIAVMYTVQVRQ